MTDFNVWLLARQLLHDPSERGNALCWALRARDEVICAKIAEAELEHFHRTEAWSIPSLIDALESGHGSEQLAFLAKYKQVSRFFSIFRKDSTLLQFYAHVHSKQINNAAEDLISILACQMSSGIKIQKVQKFLRF